MIEGVSRSIEMFSDVWLETPPDRLTLKSVISRKFPHLISLPVTSMRRRCVAVIAACYSYRLTALPSLFKTLLGMCDTYYTILIHP
jgi:hypothetical protein